MPNPNLLRGSQHPKRWLPGDPTGLTAVQDGADVDLAWSDNSQSETGFSIERRTDGAFAEIDTVGASVATYTDLAPAADTYQYRVRATGDKGNSGYSNTAEVTVV